MNEESTRNLSEGAPIGRERSVEFLRALNDASASLQRTAHSEAEVVGAFKKLMSELGFHGALALLDDSGQHLVFRAVVFPSRLVALLEKFTGMRAEGACYKVADVDVSRQVVEIGEAIFLSDTTDTMRQILPSAARPLMAVITLLLGRRSGIYAPLIIDGTVCGVLNMTSATITREDIPSIMAFANHISVAIENARLFQGMREAEARYRQLFETAGDAVLVVEPNSGNIVSANRKAAELLGYSQGELLGKPVVSLCHPELTEPMLELLKIATEKGQCSSEFQLHCRDARLLTTTIAATTFQSGERNLTQCVIRDISERKRAEMLQSATYRIATIAISDITLDELYGSIHAIVGELMDVSNFFIAIYDPEADILTLPHFVDELDNDHGPYKRGKGLTEYVIRTGKSLLVTEEEHATLIERDEAELVGPQAPIWLGVPLKSKSETFGAIVVQHYHDANAYTEREKHLLEFVSGQIATAIKRKQAEAALLDSEERFRKIFEDGPLGMAVVDSDHHFVRVNKTFCDMLGYGQHELSTLTLVELTHPDDRVVNGRLTEQPFFSEIQGVKQEKRLLKRSGEPLWAYLTASVIGNGEEEARIGMVMIEDITERKRAEEALRLAQKMESLGILAGGVAHDFNNLLVAILGQSSLALSMLPPHFPAHKHIERSVKAAERAADLTQQLLAYTGRGPFVLQPVHLNTLIRENLHLLEAVIPKNVQLLLDLAEAIPPVEADPSQLQQVIMNLILNAAEAIDDRPGTVIARTGIQTVNGDEPAYWQRTHKPLEPGSYVSLQVSDNGCGMDRETLSKIFDPFYTTKFTGRGLGLAAVLGIVRGHKGGLRVSSKPGEGTTFDLLFPFCEIDQEEPSQTGPSEARAVARGSVLVIDDEEPVRVAVSDMLELEDIRVVTAENGHEGIALYQERMNEVDVVLLDLSMPGLSGEETLEKLQQIDPNVRVILSSGYSEAEVSRRFEGKGLVGFIPKPYRLQTLLEGLTPHLLASVPLSE
jgi:PAS domain S-box-containing protein